VLARWATGLDGLRTLAEAVADARAVGIGADRAVQLLRTLAAAGALDDATVLPGALRLGTPVSRTRLAPDLAAAAHVHGDARAAAAALDRRMSARVRVLGSGRVADAALAALRSSGVACLAVPEPRADDSGADRSDLDVLADHPHPDVPEDHGALARDRPHLPVAARGRVARVGPLVVPGVTSCLRCADLHRTDRDPAWPRLAVQLAHRRPPVEPVDAALALAAGALAALTVVAWLEAPGTATGSASGVPVGAADGAVAGPGRAVTLRLPGGAVHATGFPPHPLCGCRWRLAG
jgi:hypothetical protein